MLRGEVADVKNYFHSDKKKYSQMLKFMKTRWQLYLSALETDVIESKLETILESLTFKYSRLPEFLVLMPDRVYSQNLRVCPTFKIINENTDKPSNMTSENDFHETLLTDKKSMKKAATKNQTKFFKDVYNDPNRPTDLKERVESVMHTLSKEQDKIYKEKFGTMMDAARDDERLRK